MQQLVVVIGGGIAGLAVAYELRQRSAHVHGGLRVLCLEASDRPGGNLRTDRDRGFVCEWGPNGFLDNVPATLDLIRRLGIERRMLRSREDAARRRFVFRGGRLRKVPSGVGSLLTSDILSWTGRLRVLCEPLRRRPKDERDEPVFDFAARRVGREAARFLADPMVSGVCAGDAHRLSVRASFPELWKMEAEHGSLTRAMLSRRRARVDGAVPGGPSAPPAHLTSFIDGIQELTDNLALAIDSSLRLGVPVAKVSDMGVRGFRVHLAEGAPVDASAVVLACPAFSAAEIVSSMDPEMSAAMGAIPAAALGVVHVGFEEQDLPNRPDGFGFLVPRGEGPRILGALWSSSIFDLRAPDGGALITVMIGGAHDPEAADLSDEHLLDAVRSDLRTTMGITMAPRFVRIFRHPRGIPQYTLGHRARVETIERRLEHHPGLLVCGNSYRGISVNACIGEAPGISDASLAHVGRQHALSTA